MHWFIWPMILQQEFETPRSALHLPQAKGAFSFSAVKIATTHREGKMVRFTPASLSSLRENTLKSSHPLLPAVN